MKKHKVQMLQPLEVGEIYPVKSKSKNGERFKGCEFTVKYTGTARVDARKLSDMGLYSGGYGSKYTGIEVQEIKDQPNMTTVKYFFREGMLFPEPFARANNLRDSLKSAKTDFVPTNVYAVSAEYKYDLFGDSYVRGYRLEVYYPKSALNNPLFKKFITHGKPKVVGVRADGFNKNVIVTYRFKDKDDVTKAYETAMAFKTYILGQMKSNEDTNKK